MQALYIEAGLANVLEMDDFFREAVLHPGPAVLPVVAHGVRYGGLNVTGALDAVVRGYEASIRVGLTLGSGHYAHWHNTATAGVFGAAAAAASAWGLTHEQTVWALGNAGTQSAGLWQVRLENVMSKQLHTGHAAWAGLSAASLAQAGFTGPRFILEGECGFYAAMCTNPQPDRLLEPDETWKIHNTSFKPWPACRHTHPTIDAVLALREGTDNSRPLEFDDMVVGTFADALKICHHSNPKTPTERKFSLPYVAAATAQWGPLKPEHFEDAAAQSLDLWALMTRIRVEVDAEANRFYPRHFGATVQIQKHGVVQEHRVVDALGDPEQPLSMPQLFEKARVLMTHGGLQPERIESVLRATSQLMDQLDEPDLQTAMPLELVSPLIPLEP